MPPTADVQSVQIPNFGIVGWPLTQTSFERGFLGGWRAARGTPVDGDDGTPKVVHGAGLGRIGRSSVYFKNLSRDTPLGLYIVGPRFRVNPPTRVRATAWGRTRNLQGQARDVDVLHIDVIWTDKDGQYLSYDTGKIRRGTHDWEQTMIIADAPAQAIHGHIEGGFSAANGEAWLTDIRVSPLLVRQA